MTAEKNKYTICVVGLGYVGLPLATRLSIAGYEVTGFDINIERINSLKNNVDINDDINMDDLIFFNKNSNLTSNIKDVSNSNIFIITVPTPINSDKTPDLEPIKNSSRLIGSIIRKNSIVVYESTVYPGVTDDICTPILERESGLVLNRDFSTGYSPERIVPGDKINTIEKIKKVVSASNPDALKVLSNMYSSIIEAGIHIAPSIKIAEASKVTENIQRDVNIALINELHQLFSAIGIETNDVIDAASTKWNFMSLRPGLVGGHCISIDPYYLMHKSQMEGFTPSLMRHAREINDGMEEWVVNSFLRFCHEKQINLSSCEVTFLGYTFKENCNDVRNTKVKNLILSLKKLKIDIGLWDPLISKDDQDELKNLEIKIYKKKPIKSELLFLCVYHDEILEFLKESKGHVYDYRKLGLS